MELLTSKIANKIGMSLGHTEDQIEIVAYGLFGVFQSIFLLVVLTVLGALTGTLFPTLVAFFGGSVLRRRTGGFHASSPMVCNIVSVLTCLGISLLSTYLFINLKEISLLITVIAVYLICIYIIIDRAPLDSPNKPITSSERRKKFKKTSLIISVTYLISGTTAFIFFEHLVIISCAISLWLATVWQTITLTRIGARALGLADNTLSAILKKRR